MSKSIWLQRQPLIAKRTWRFRFKRLSWTSEILSEVVLIMLQNVWLPLRDFSMYTMFLLINSYKWYSKYSDNYMQVKLFHHNILNDYIFCVELMRQECTLKIQIAVQLFSKFTLIASFLWMIPVKSRSLCSL